MCIAAIDWARRQSTGSPTLKAVLRAVADYADEHGRSWPSQVTLAKDTDLSERAVRDALKGLEERGFLTRTARRRPNNSRATDMIELALSPYHQSRETSEDAAEQVPAPRSGTPTGASFRYPYRQEVPGVPAAGSGLTTFEPPLNQDGSFARADTSVPGVVGVPGFSDAAWQLCLEKLVASGVERQSAKRFLGKALRALRGRVEELMPAISEACDAGSHSPIPEIERLIASPRQKQASSPPRLAVARRFAWPENYREIFWELYPRKTDKLNALNVLDKAFKSDQIDFGEICCGVERLAASGTDLKFMPHPSTFLRNERWNDNFPKQEPKATSGRAASSSGGNGFGRLAIAKLASRQMRSGNEEPFGRQSGAESQSPYFDFGASGPDARDEGGDNAFLRGELLDFPQRRTVR